MATFDLEDRMTKFAGDVRDFLKMLPRTDANQVYTNQLLRSSSSIGANYLETNDALGRKDFLVKVRTARREGKETRYWLKLLEIPNTEELKRKHIQLTDETTQLIRILSAMIIKIEQAMAKEASL